MNNTSAFFQSGSHGEPACVRRISQSRPHPSDPVPGSLPVHLLKGNLRASIESEELLIPNTPVLRVVSIKHTVFVAYSWDSAPATSNVPRLDARLWQSDLIERAINSDGKSALVPGTDPAAHRISIESKANSMDSIRTVPCIAFKGEYARLTGRAWRKYQVKTTVE